MAKYLRYVLRNIEPLRIADDSSSQRGQTSTLRYIPGSTIRGLVVNTLSANKKFETFKKSLFSLDIRFLNAYALAEYSSGERIIELFPSPKGFDEDKTECVKKEIQNTFIDGEKTKNGLKRADLGTYCFFEDGCIHYYKVETGSDMKIQMNLESGGKKNVFRNEYIKPGYRFVGYIAIEKEEFGEFIRKVFDGPIILGNGRSAGMGKCQIESCGYCNTIPYERYQTGTSLFNRCYMMLLSNTVMRDGNGEYCGLDMSALAKQMGVEKLEIERCSASTVRVNGFNRVWGGKIPSVVMYEQGSVFQMSYKGKFTAENARRLLNTGIGVRRNEGFGRVIFLENFEQLHCKKEERFTEKNMPDTGKNCSEEDEEVLKAVARCYYMNQMKSEIRRYVVNNPLKKGDIADSQLGQIEALSVSYLYEPQKGLDTIRDFLNHAEEKEQNNNIQKKRKSISLFSKTVLDILDLDLEQALDLRMKDTVMGVKKEKFLIRNEADMLKLQFLVEWIRYYNKLEKEETQNG